MIKTVFFSASMSALSAVIVSPTVAQQTGADLYAASCTRCHKNVTSMPQSSDRITAVLESGSVRQHRFSLSENDIKQLVEYIKSTR